MSERKHEFRKAHTREVKSEFLRRGCFPYTTYHNKESLLFRQDSPRMSLPPVMPNEYKIHECSIAQQTKDPSTPLNENLNDIGQH